mmetsp:Transcript_91433/g.295843  ORF Transcript_91433/g.295843 Transcript_91433/m.295843 type:complete len:222 (+) Transcript_91433:245-910(+)
MRVQHHQVAVRCARGEVEHADALDEAGDACSRLQVADVRLRARLQDRLLSVFTQDSSQGSDLDGIAQRGARAVALRNSDHLRIQAALPHGVFDDGLLRGAVRRRHTGTSAILIDGAADQDGHPISRLDGIVADFQLYAAQALASGEAVGRLVEGEAAAVRREHAGAAQGDVGHRTDQSVRSDDQAVPQVRRHARSLLARLLLAHGHLCNAACHQGGRTSSL